MKVHCRKCQITSIGQVDQTKFEVRSRTGSIFKCLQCHCGIRVCGLFLRSKPIPADEWEWLQLTWEQDFGPVLEAV